MPPRSADVVDARVKSITVHCGEYVYYDRSAFGASPYDKVAAGDCMDGQLEKLTRDNYDEWKHRWERGWSPYARLTVRTSLSAEEIKERISERTDEVKWYRRLKRTGITDEMRFLGKVKDSGFTLEPRYTSSGWLFAVAKGAMRRGSDGATGIDISIRPRPGMAIALLVGMTFVFIVTPVLVLIGTKAPPLAYSGLLVTSLLFALLYKFQLCSFFRDALVIPAFFSTMGEVQFDE